MKAFLLCHPDDDTTLYVLTATDLEWVDFQHDALIAVGKVRRHRPTGWRYFIPYGATFPSHKIDANGIASAFSSFK